MTDKQLTQYARDAAICINELLPQPEDCAHTYSAVFSYRINALSHRRRRRVLYAMQSGAAGLLLLALLGLESAFLISPAILENTARLVSALAH